MNKLTFKGDWDQVKGRLKQKYGQLTDDDLVYTEGKVDELIGRLEKKLGVAKDKITRLISEIQLYSLRVSRRRSRSARRRCRSAGW